MLGRRRPAERGIVYRSRDPRRRSVHSTLDVGKLRTRGRDTEIADTSTQRGAREVRTPETVLGMLQKRGEQRKPVHDLYRQLYNPLLYEKAYERIYANQGAMTCGASKETADGMSRKKIQGIIDHIRRESYRWTPARRIFIPKKNGKKRPLGLTTWSDKLVQEVIRLLLEAYYEPQFSEHSHGFRPKRGCHTALAHIQHAWSGVHWYIEGDISQCFDRLDHDIMLKILGRSITDQRFLRLIKHLLQAGYLEEWQYHCTHSGTPQGGVLSPLLANIYLNEIDHYVKEHLLPNYTRGKFRKENLAYQRLMKQSRRLHQQGEHQQAKQLKPSTSPQRIRTILIIDDCIMYGMPTTSFLVSLDPNRKHKRSKTAWAISYMMTSS